MPARKLVAALVFWLFLSIMPLLMFLSFAAARDVQDIEMENEFWDEMMSPAFGLAMWTAVTGLVAAARCKKYERFFAVLDKDVSDQSHCPNCNYLLAEPDSRYCPECGCGAMRSILCDREPAKS